jgi:hypothetical protein
VSYQVVTPSSDVQVEKTFGSVERIVVTVNDGNNWVRAIPLSFDWMMIWRKRDRCVRNLELRLQGLDLYDVKSNLWVVVEEALGGTC